MRGFSLCLPKSPQPLCTGDGRPESGARLPMPALDIPFFGTLVLCLILISASYTMAWRWAPVRVVHICCHRPAGARMRPARSCSLRVCVLAYAFQVHDFRIRYVARYSDRSMPWWYLITSLWGGQDGSLLWWSFLLSGYTFFAIRWLRGRYTELQPWIIATLMSILIFFAVLMLFAANPFATYIRTTPRRRRRPQPASAELLDGDPSADPLHGLRRLVGAVRDSGRRAHHRPPRQRVGPRGAPLVDDRLDVPRRSACCSAASGRTRSSAGAATGPGIRSRTPRSCRGWSARPTCTR